MRIQIGDKNEDGTFQIKGQMSQEEADFISGIGIAALMQAGMMAIMEQQEEILEDIETEGPMQ